MTIQEHPVPQDMPVNIVLTVAGVNAVLAALGQLQYNAVSGYIHSIQQQTDQQVVQYLRGKATEQPME